MNTPCDTLASVRPSLRLDVQRRHGPMDATITTILSRLDRVRWWMLRVLGPLAVPIVRDRELRFVLWATALTLVSLVLAMLCPLVLLAVGPVLLGVPHVLSDVRYLVVRPALHRNHWLWPSFACVLVAGVTASVEVGLVGAALAAVLGGRSRWRVLFAAGALCLAVLAAREAYLDQLAFAHLHNVIAILFVLLWRPVRRWIAVLPLALMGLGCGWILFGGSPVFATHSSLPPSLGMDTMRSVLAPGLDANIGTRLVVLFAFLQALHYGAWLRLMPEHDRSRATPRTWAATWRALVDDFGRPALYLTVAFAILLAVWAIIDLANARTAYLRAVVFHGHLELVALGALASGIRLRRT